MIYNCFMVWVYLSPHLDDAALSCGGLIWQQVQAGDPVQVWTVFAGEPPPGPLSLFAQVLHKRWGFTHECAVAERRREDIRAMQVLGASIQHFAVPDAVYRRHPKTNEVLYHTWDDVINGIAPGEEYLVDRLVIDLARLLPASATLMVPLTLGNHIDHLLTRVAAEQLHRPIRYYLDFPYVEEYAGEIPSLVPEGYQRKIHPITARGLAFWQDSVAAYASQLSSFWNDEGEMREAIVRHCEKFGGTTLWEIKE
jgi:LmbE family N-acetylglucosaminyl deacetylase